MFKKSTEELQVMGADITTREIHQQPELWAETLINYHDSLEKITLFLEKVKASTSDKIRVIFTGAGTSQYVGDTLVPYLTSHGDTKKFIFQSIATTDIVAAPEQYFLPAEVTILVSFARSGNSPESVSAVNLANQLIDNIHHITITCAKDGSLAKEAQNKNNQLLLLMPERANDAGFAMTGSFSCMTLMGLLIFDNINSLVEKDSLVKTMIDLGHDTIERESEIKAIVDRHFNRIIYLGSGTLSGITREAQLKVLELTAGKIATVYDSSMGFRHGPKSFVNEQTLVFDFISNNTYTRQYDIDILEEVNGDGIAAGVIGIGQQGDSTFTGDMFELSTNAVLLPDGYLALVDMIFAQIVALLSSIKVGNTPDTPSPSGTVNRVVKGVRVHEYKNNLK